jgi:hypothetical protein
VTSSLTYHTWESRRCDSLIVRPDDSLSRDRKTTMSPSQHLWPLSIPFRAILYLLTVYLTTADKIYCIFCQHITVSTRQGCCLTRHVCHLQAVVLLKLSGNLHEIRADTLMCYILLSRVYGSVTNNNESSIRWLDLVTPSYTISLILNQFEAKLSSLTAEDSVYSRSTTDFWVWVWVWVWVLCYDRRSAGQSILE